MQNTQEKTPPKKTRQRGYSTKGTALRHLTMLEYIPKAPRSISVEDLMKRLEDDGHTVVKRTIERSLEKLADDYGLVCNKGERNRNLWSFGEDVKLVMFPRMDDHTALSFQLVADFMKPLLPPDTMRAIDPWIKKASDVLASRENKLARWREKVLVHPLGLPRIRPKITTSVTETVFQATLLEKPLEISYLKRDAVKHESYRINPQGLVFRNHIIYLVATKVETSEERYFALHRVRSAQLCESEKFSRPTGFALLAYVDEKFGVPQGKSPTMQLKLCLSKPAALSVEERPITNRQSLIPDGNGEFILTVPDAPNTSELRQWLWSMGPEAEVVEPGFLRAEIAENIASMAKKYGAIT